MRVRSKGSLEFKSSTWKLYKTATGKVLSSGTAVLVPPVGSMSTITDDNSKRSGKLKRTRFCKHVREDALCLPYSGHYWSSATNHTQYTDNTGIGGSDCNVNFRTLFDGLPHLEALQYFEAGCQEQEILLPNLFLELHSIRSTFDFLLGSWKKLKTYASGFLAYEFGVKPLLSDTEKLAQFVASVPKRLAWLRKNQGRPVKVSFTKDCSELFPQIKGTHTGSVTQYETRLDTRATYHAYALMVYDLARLSDLELKARMALRATGFDNPLGVVWEAIPYSFVIDWFVRVGDLLDALAPKVTLPYKFIDVGWSLRVTESKEYFAGSRFPKTVPPGMNWVGRHRRTTYFRYPGLPVSISSLSTGSPGLKQLALAAALTIQKAG